MLFYHCMHIFQKYEVLCRSRKIFLTGTIALFFICTIQCSLNIIPLTLLQHWEVGTLPSNLLYIFNNLIADILLIYRCYSIWSCKKYILYVPLFLTLGSTGFAAVLSNHYDIFGESSTIGQQMPLFISLVMNIGLTLLSAGRIWWISRELKILGPQVFQKYNTIIALIIESGAMYCIAIIAYLISINVNTSLVPWNEVTTSKIISAIFFGILQQVVGIVPTLIVFRIG
ncbi:hypothetical protein BDZ94DRAFT_1315450 [Collybia nuda]|uniref:Uncharacterized protein n=1 Tax=Collybia nuda TaxID=64659 RepID=A0A9P5XT93_9AGAR|nr:hypothetical protein BDZ94DRAFT_1315450 [Collybia nuda]